MNYINVTDETQHLRNLEEVYKYLELRHRDGERVMIRFNGEDLYSGESIDEMYEKVTGKTYSHYQVYIESEKEKMRREEEEYRKTLPELREYWSEEGKKYIPSHKWEEWDKVVHERLNDIYRGLTLESALKIIKMLLSDGNHNFEEVKEEFDTHGHSGHSAIITLGLIKQFGGDVGWYFNEYVARLRRIELRGGEG